jgi:hypothetical protein
MFFCAERDVHEGSLQGADAGCAAGPGAARGVGVDGKAMTVELARRDIIRQEVLELHRR